MRGTTSRSRRALLATGALTVCFGGLAVPGSALAGTASILDGNARYDAANGETNNVRIAQLPGGLFTTYRFTDTAGVVPGTGCTLSATVPGAAECTLPAASRARVNLRDGNDSVAPAAVDPLFASLSSEGDQDDDTMIGGPVRDVLDGNAGNDRMRGADGNDGMIGAAGDDTVNGEQGADEVNGNAGDDLVIGGTGPDRMLGELGSDVLNADDNAGGDFLDCGGSFIAPGNDLAIYNKGDTVSSNCELKRLVS
jgi:Ca2+-binding RTX toxin-like protein